MKKHIFKLFIGATVEIEVEPHQNRGHAWNILQSWFLTKYGFHSSESFILCHESMSRVLEYTYWSHEKGKFVEMYSYDDCNGAASKVNPLDVPALLNRKIVDAMPLHPNFIRNPERHYGLVRVS